MQPKEAANKSTLFVDSAVGLNNWDFALSPNPAGEEVYVQLIAPNGSINEPTFQLITIFDANGRLVWEQKIDTAAQSLRVDVSEWAAGVYLVALRSTEGVLMKRCVVSN